MGVVGNIKDKISTPLSRSNNTNIKSLNTKNIFKKNEKNYDNLPFLNSQNPENKNTLQKQKRR